MDLAGVVKLLLSIINPLIVLVAALSLFVFFKGLTVFISKSGDEKSHKDGKNLMIWGIIALFVMVSFLGIIQLVQKDLGLSDGKKLPGVLQLPEDKDFKK